LLKLALIAMRRIRKFLVLVVVLAVFAAVAIAVMGHGDQRQRKSSPWGASDAPVPVLVSDARVADVPVYLDGVGTVRALNMVNVHTLVDGTLLSVNFREGQEVKVGDVLARVDPTTYQALYDQAVAKKALDEAQLANARVDLERYATLMKTNAVTRQQYDTQRALINQLEAQVKVDQGVIDNAKAYLNWCTVVSPLNGLTGIRLVDAGNIVHAGDSSGNIVVVTQIQPISVLFNLPQQQLPEINRAFGRGPLTVLATEADNRTVLDTGTLQVINNQVDQTTGTVQFKAEFANSERQLWPGQFVNVRLKIDTLRQVVVVPTAAVQRGPNGAFVYVLQPDSTVAVRPVTIRQQDERDTAIGEGLDAAAKVVTTGFAQLTAGRKVRVASGSTREQPVAAPGRADDHQVSEPPRSRGRRGGDRRTQATPGAAP
jgi:membrane fusion protein, multidrug efflux system